MAKQIAGLCFFEGTFDDLVFYKMDKKYYVRVKSSLSSKRVKTSPEFKWTMFYASLMARASRIGSVIYKSLPSRWRQFWMYRSFTGEALTLLKENPYTDEDVKAILWQRYVAYWEAHKAADPDNIIWQPVPTKIRKRRKYSEETIQRWIASGKLRDPAAEEKKRLELEKKRERVRAKLEQEAREEEVTISEVVTATIPDAESIIMEPSSPIGLTDYKHLFSRENIVVTGVDQKITLPTSPRSCLYIRYDGVLFIQVDRSGVVTNLQDNIKNLFHQETLCEYYNSS